MSKNILINYQETNCKLSKYSSLLQKVNNIDECSISILNVSKLAQLKHIYISLLLLDHFHTSHRTNCINIDTPKFQDNQ